MTLQHNGVKCGFRVYEMLSEEVAIKTTHKVLLMRSSSSIVDIRKLPLVLHSLACLTPLGLPRIDSVICSIIFHSGSSLYYSVRKLSELFFLLRKPGRFQ